MHFSHLKLKPQGAPLLLVCHNYKWVVIHWLIWRAWLRPFFLCCPWPWMDKAKATDKYNYNDNLSCRLKADESYHSPTYKSSARDQPVKCPTSQSCAGVETQVPLPLDLPTPIRCAPRHLSHLYGSRRIALCRAAHLHVGHTVASISRGGTIRIKPSGMDSTKFWKPSNHLKS